MGKSLQLIQHAKTLEIVANLCGNSVWLELYKNTVQPDGQRQRMTERCGYWGLHSRSVGARVLEREGSGKQPANSLEQVQRGFTTVLPGSDERLRRANA
jgi:hypothetical protein